MVRRLLTIMIALVVLCPVWASAADPIEGSAPIPIAAKAALLMEPLSGQVIFEVNPDAQVPVASVTKIMGILLAVEAVESGRCTLDERVTISKDAAGMGGSQVLLDVGEVQPLSTLLTSMIVGSANDATVAMGEHLFGSEPLFVDRMNERARELGMQDTVFVNSTGLPAAGQHSTARDVAQMSQALIRHPLYFEYSKVWMDELDHGDGRMTQLTNTNRLVRTYDGADDIKTGSTNEAGYCMSATAKRGDMRLIAVVLGAGSGKERFAIAGKMMDYGFATYRRFQVAQKGAKVRGEMAVTGGAAASVKLQLADDLALLIKKGDEEPVELEPRLPVSLHAPVVAGQKVGTVDVLRGGVKVGEIGVVAMDDVARQNYGTGWGRVWAKWFYR